MVEARRKRATFLSEAAVEMGLQNVRVQCARAESLDVRDGFDLVTARAVGNPVPRFRDCRPRIAVGGVLMLYATADQTFDQIPTGPAA